ncbi:MAG: LPS export ABC transporter periplasmic protein LptC [Pseudomonadota bacterium]
MSVRDAIGPYDDVRRSRRSVEQRRARRHTRTVKGLRVLLPAVSCVIALGLIGVAMLPKLFPISALAGLSLTADGLVMNTPRLAGHLGQGRRYEVVANRAVQSLLNPSKLSLEELHANLDMGDGQRITIDGNNAAYDTDTEILILDGGVQIESTDGNTVSLPGATVNLKEGIVTSDGAIEIQSPKGEIRAGAITVLGGGDLIRLTDGVSITIMPST